MPEGIGYGIEGLQAALANLFAPQPKTTPDANGNPVELRGFVDDQGSPVGVSSPEAPDQLGGALDSLRQGGRALGAIGQSFAEVPAPPHMLPQEAPQAPQEVPAPPITEEHRRAIRERMYDPHTAHPRGSEEALDELEFKELQAEADAADVARRVEEQAAQIEQDALAKTQKVEAEFAPRQDRLNNERDLRVAGRLRELERLSDEILSTKVDPWRDIGAGQKAMAALGVFIGGLVQPKLGRNPAMDIINRSLDRNLKAQQAELDNKKAVFGQRRNLLGIMQDQYKDKQAALDATKAVQLRQIVLEQDKRLAGLKNEKALENWLKMRQELLGKAREHHVAAAQREAGRLKLEEDRRQFNKQQGLAWWKAKQDVRLRDRALDQEDLELEFKRSAAEAAAKGDVPPPGTISGNTVGSLKVRVKDPKTGKVLEERNDLTVENKDTLKFVADQIDSVRGQVGSLRDIESLGTDYNLLNDAEKTQAQAAYMTIVNAAAEGQKGIQSDQDVDRIFKRVGDMRKGPQGAPDFLKFWNNLDGGERAKVLGFVQRAAIREGNSKIKTRLPSHIEAAIDLDDVISVAEPAKKTRARVPLEIHNDLAKADTTPRDLPLNAAGNPTGMTSEWGEQIMALAKSGKTFEEVKDAHDRVLQERTKLNTTPEPSSPEAKRALAVQRTKANQAYQEVKRRLKRLEVPAKAQKLGDTVLESIGIIR